MSVLQDNIDWFFNELTSSKAYDPKSHSYHKQDLELLVAGYFCYKKWQQGMTLEKAGLLGYEVAQKVIKASFIPNHKAKQYTLEQLFADTTNCYFKEANQEIRKQYKEHFKQIQFDEILRAQGSQGVL